MSGILSFFITRDFYSRCVAHNHQTDSDVTCSKSCDERKITKRIER